MGRESIYDKFIEYKWWTDIDKRNVERWLKNFGEKKHVGRFILDNVIFYSKEQLGSYTLNVVNQIRGELFENQEKSKIDSYQNDDYYFEQWEEYKKELKVIAAANQEDVGSSAFQVIRRYRTLLGEDLVSGINGIEQCIKNGVKEFIFVDDFSGSGRQMKDFLNLDIEILGKKMKVHDIPKEFPEVNITIALYVIHKNALELFRREFPLLKIKYVDLIDEKIDFLNEKSIFYNNMSREQRNEIIEFISSRRETIIRENKKYSSIEKYQLNIPIIFEHGCPNNTLLLLFAETENWRQLFKLGEEK